MLYTKLKIQNQEYEIAVNQSGSGAPTGEGINGLIYMDTDTEALYVYGPSGWKPLTDNFYTKQEIDNLFASIEHAEGGAY